MTPEEKSLLERTYRLSEENHKILVSMRRSARLANILRILYWVVIIGISVGAYFAVQPYLTLMLSYIHTLTGSLGAANSPAQSLGNYLNKFPLQ